MKRKTATKISLSKETLRHLDLGAARGGTGATAATVCTRCTDCCTAACTLTHCRTGCCP